MPELQPIDTAYIKLDSFFKLANLAMSGGEAMGRECYHRWYMQVRFSPVFPVSDCRRCYPDLGSDLAR